MPTYELALIMRALPRAGLLTSAERVTTQLLTNGGVIRRIESLGERNLPQRTRVHDAWHTKGHYFIVHTDIPLKALPIIVDEYTRDNDVLRKQFVAVKEKPAPVCSLDDELKNPSERPSVQRMIEIGRKPPRFKKIFNPSTGLDFFPLKR